MAITTAENAAASTMLMGSIALELAGTMMHLKRPTSDAARFSNALRSFAAPLTFRVARNGWQGVERQALTGRAR
jgi:hypothetical protein